MPWPSLVPPTAGTVITVAWESAQVNDPLLWLRLLTGNADPPGPNYVVVSSGTAATAWGKVSGDVLAPGAALANLGYTPVRNTTDTMSGSLTANGLSSTAGIGAAGNIVSTSGSISAAGNIVSTAGSISAAGNVSAGANITTATGTVQGSIVSATSQVQAPSANISGNVAAGSANITGTATINAISATSIGATGNIVSTAGSISAAGNVSAAGNITTTTGTVLGSIVQATASMNVGGQTVWNAGHFAQPQATPAANRVPVSDASGKLDAGWLPAASIAGVPTGLIALWGSPEANVPAGWVVNHSFDGRFVVSVGGSLGVGLGGSGGSTQHNHTVDWAHSHGSAALSVSGNTGGPSSSGTGGGPGATFADGSHTHAAGGLDVGGSTDGAGSSATATTTTNHLPPYFALFYIQKS